MRCFSDFGLAPTIMIMVDSSGLIVDVLLDFDSRKLDEDIIESAGGEGFPEGFHHKYYTLIMDKNFNQIFYRRIHASTTKLRPSSLRRPYLQEALLRTINLSRN